jgi:periplasmic protein TonB
MASTESQNKTIAFAITTFIHVLLLLFLIFFNLTTPLPPFVGGSGVVLNLGFVEEGFGSEAPKNTSESINQKEINEAQNATESNLLTSEEENEIKADNNNVKIEPTSKNSKPVERVNEKAINTVNSEPKTEDINKISETNNGDKIGKIGDQGNPNGDINAKALYGSLGSGGNGNGGNGNGASLDLSGWRWERRPKVKDENEDENGKIVFQITIDENGDIIKINTLESTVNASVEKLYKNEVEKLTFVKTDNKIPALTSSGRITFIIRAR